MKLRDKIFLGAAFAVASLQLLGFVTSNRNLRGLGLISTASPLPFVFSSHHGLETFAQTYAVTLHYGAKQHRVDIDAELYSKLSGPYNLRNAYGAIFSHGPVLTMKEERNPLIDSVVRYGFCPGGSLLRAFEFSFPVTRVVIESRPANPKQSTWTYEVECQ